MGRRGMKGKERGDTEKRKNCERGKRGRRREWKK